MSFIGSTTAYPTVSPAVGDLLPLVQGGELKTVEAGDIAQLPGAVGVNLQTGTTYTYLTGDRAKLVSHTNAAAIAATLPQSGSAGFEAGWFMYVENRGAGALTITPTTSTIDGSATLVLNQNQGCLIVSDGTNYFTMRGIGGGGSGTVTSVAAANGVETTSGGAITATGTIRGAYVVNTETGTTYTYVTGDRGALVTHTNASAIAGTLPQAGTTGFEANWFMFVQNRGAGTLTITPTTSTIDGAASLALTTGQGVLVVSDGTNYFTMRGAASGGGGGGGLTNWTEAVSTSAPNATIPVSSFTATNAAGSVDAALCPKGNGAVLAHIPDSALTGGNKRGTQAVDLQTARNVAASVASGQRSVIVGGFDNTASGTRAVCVGGNANISSGSDATICGGSGNTASGSSSTVAGGANNTASDTNNFVGGGNGNTASGAQYSTIVAGQSNSVASQYGTIGGGGNNNINSNGTSAFIGGGRENVGNGVYAAILGGFRGTARGIRGARPFSNVSTSLNAGDRQDVTYNQFIETTNGTTTALSADGLTAATDTSVVMPTDSVYAFNVLVAARQASTDDSAGFQIIGCAKNSNGTVSIVGSVTVTALGADAGAAAWTATVVANNTLKSVEVLVTGEAAKTINWCARINTVEVVG